MEPQATEYDHIGSGLNIHERVLKDAFQDPAGKDLTVIENAELAGEREVSFAPGWEFHIHAIDGPFIRLAFGWATVADIHEGIRRLARCVKSLTT